MKTKPYRAVSFSQSAVEKALEECGSLIADVKYDGVRLNLCVTDGAAHYLSRVSTTLPALEHLNGFSERWEAFLADDEQPFKNGLMIDGEVMVKDVDFNTSSGLLRTKWLKEKNYEFSMAAVESEWHKGMKGQPFQIIPENLKVIVYGVIPMDVVESGEDYDRMNVLMQSDCAIQVALLERHFPEIEWTIAESHDVFDMTELNALYENVRELGHEGLVIKDPWGIYRRGKKTGWWKMKPEESIDGTITGLVWGTKGLANEGKVIGFEVLLENGVVVNACGLTKAQMDEFTNAFIQHNKVCIGVDFSHNYVVERVQEDPIMDNPYAGYAVEVKFMERTPDGSLRHPSFDKFRGTEDNPTEKM